MTKEEALKMALEALQFALHVGFDESSERQIRKGAKARQQHRQAITAIKEALAQPVQEPVAWLSTDSIGERYLCFDKPLDKDLMKPLYTTPPQRTWVGLTDDEIKDLWVKYRASLPRYLCFAKAIEAKLKEKNNG